MLRLLDDLAKARATITADAGRLLCWSPEPLPADLVERLRLAKANLVPLLEATSRRLAEVLETWPVEWRQLYWERQAILEIDGGLRPAVAADRAYHEVAALILECYGIRYEPASLPTCRLLDCGRPGGGGTVSKKG